MFNELNDFISWLGLILIAVFGTLLIFFLALVKYFFAVTFGV